MVFSAFDPVTQDDRYQRIQNELDQEKQMKGSMDPAVAQRVAQIYKDAPYIPASVILSMAKSGTSPETVEAIKKTAAVKTSQDLNPQKPKKKGWFQEVIHDNVKAASRWSFAALQFVPDLAQNVASQAFSADNPAGFDGWFKSTQLGTLMSNTQEAGEGFFLSEEAMEKQAERARRVRGTINGSAWTIGRGAAQRAFTPGSKPYSFLSGFVDGAVALGADPTLVGGKAVASVRAARAAVPALSSANEIAAASKLARGAAGLDSSEGILFEGSKFGQWVLNDERAKRFTARLLQNSTDTAKSVEEKTLFVVENWPGISPVKAREFAEAADQNQILGLLGEASARLSSNPDDILLPRDIRDVRLAKRTAELSDDIKERVPFGRGGFRKWFETMPKGSVVINGSSQEKREAVLSYARYLRGVGIGDETQEFKDVMQKVISAYSSTDPAQARAGAKQAYDYAFEVIAKKAGLKSEDRASVVNQIIKSGDPANSRAFNIDEFGDVDDGGAIQILKEYIPGLLDEFPEDVRDKLAIASPGALVELTDEVQVLPDFRKLRALAGNPFITRSSKTGDQRRVAAIAEFVQQDIWKPLALATGGYMMRNMLDAHTRMAMAGHTSIFRHPQDFIMWVMRKKGRFDITGEDFGGVGGFKNIFGDTKQEQKSFWKALTFDLHKNLKDPYNAEYRNVKNGSFALVSRSQDADAHITGYVDNLALIFGDQIESKVASLTLEGLDRTERLSKISSWLKEPKQKELLSEIRDYFRTGVEVQDPKGNIKKLIPIDADDDVLIEAWVDRLANVKVNTSTRNNESLNIVAAYNRVPLTEVAPNGRLTPVGKVNLFADNYAVEDFISGTGEVGSIIRLPDGTEGVVVRKGQGTREGIDTFTGRPFEPENQLVVQPVHPTTAFTADSLGTNQLRELLDDLGANDELAKFVKRAERGEAAELDRGSKALKAKDSFVDFFFVGLYGKATQLLEKSPVFRQVYYREVFDNADLLSPSAAREIIDRAKVNAGELGVKIERYLGGKKVLQKLEDVADRTPSKPNIAIWDESTRIDLQDGFTTPEELKSFTEIEKSISRAFVESVDDESFVYHTSPSNNFNSILNDGLQPRQTVNEFGEIEDVASISVSSDLPSLFSNAPSPASQAERLGSGELMIMRFSLPKNIKVEYGTRYAEGVVYDSIDSRNIEILSSDGTWKSLRDVSIGFTGEASGTLEQLDDYAKAIALNETKQILYNATERSNFEDVMRVIVPFGAAWKEVLGTYAKAVIEDPTRIRKAQLIVTGGERSDMGIFGGTEGQGFFYKDATTGEYSFNFPLSGSLTQLLTGQTAPLQAPLKRVSIGLGVVPSIGPMAQIAASQIIPDTPSADAISKILLPYGEKSSFNIAPMWVTRFIEAVDGNTQNLQTVYGNTYIETLRALSASGEYDLANFDEQEKLYADARQKARVLTGLRALGQFLGPTSPSPEFQIDTLQGDMYGTQLVKEFQKLQSENYDTAVQRFLEIYGNDAILYVSNKTESVAGGLEATDDFGDWEREEGKGLISKYRDVAGFMAPGGDDFSFEVWSRQIEKGLRRRLTDREIVELAQYRVGAAQYRELRDKLPGSPSDEQKAWLRQWRKKLNSQYPGFPTVAEFNPGEFPGKIEQLGRLVQEEALADNDIAKATRTYLTARRNAIQQYVNAGGSESGFKTAQSTANLRAWLVDISKALREEVPEFSRIYDRLLSAEVEE